MSTVGSLVLVPKNLSSKLSKLVAALVSEVAALVAEVAAAVAEFAAFVALVVAEAASTNKSHLALSVFVVKGCDPEEV